MLSQGSACLLSRCVCVCATISLAKIELEKQGEIFQKLLKEYLTMIQTVWVSYLKRHLHDLDWIFADEKPIL